MLARVEEHAFQVEPVGGLDVGTLGDRHARCAQPFGELVPDPLELAEVKQSRVATAAGGLIEPAHRVGSHERIG